MAKDYFRHKESSEVVKLIDHAAHRSGLDRTRVFEDFLLMMICGLSGEQMEEQYMHTIQPYTSRKKERRPIDVLPQAMATIINAMETTRADILGDVFEGGITRGHNGQFFTPEPVCKVMARITDEAGVGKTVCDPTCGSGRLLLAAAEVDRNREFVGQDIDLRCVRITAINLALWNLYGWVIHGNSLTLERKLIYRTGFDGRGFIHEVPVGQYPATMPPRSNDEGNPANVIIDQVMSKVQRTLFE